MSVKCKELTAKRFMLESSGSVKAGFRLGVSYQQVVRAPLAKAKIIHFVGIMGSMAAAQILDIRLFLNDSLPRLLHSCLHLSDVMTAQEWKLGYKSLDRSRTQVALPLSPRFAASSVLASLIS